MKAYCEKCGVIDSFTIKVNMAETTSVGVHQVTCVQKHVFCDNCNTEAFLYEIDDFNIYSLHVAYCEAEGIAPWCSIPELNNY